MSPLRPCSRRAAAASAGSEVQVGALEGLLLEERGREASRTADAAQMQAEVARLQQENAMLRDGSSGSSSSSDEQPSAAEHMHKD